MKSFQVFFKSILLFIIIVSCSEEKRIISSDKLQMHDDIFYEVNNKNPFSGKVIDKYDAGHNKKETHYKDGVKTGIETMWYKNGQIKEEIKYKKSKKNGLAIKWYDNGQKMEEISYKIGDKDSIATYWDREGNVIGLYMYYKDNLVYVTLDEKTIYYFIESSFEPNSSAKSLLITNNKKVYKVLDDNSMQLKNAKNLLVSKKNEILNELITAKNNLKVFKIQNNSIKLSDRSLSLIQIFTHFEAEKNKIQIEMGMNKENINQLKDQLKHSHEFKKNGLDLLHLSLRAEVLKAHYNQLISVCSYLANKFNELPTKKIELENLELKKQSLEKLYIELEKKYQKNLIIEKSIF